jgi:hypothetical protein
MHEETPFDRIMLAIVTVVGILIGYLIQTRFF